MFDITRTGIQRTSAVEPHPQSKSRRRRNVTLLAVGGATVSIAAGLFLLPRAVAHKVDKSIAVLPFENFSDNQDNAYFAERLQDDVLTNLSKIGEPKLISRTSVIQY